MSKRIVKSLFYITHINNLPSLFQHGILSHRQVKAQNPPVSAPAEKQAELKIESDEPPVYRKSKSVLTYRERMLFHALRKAIQNEYWIMTKVRMADFVWLSNEAKSRRFHLNQILCKHVDFLLCTRLFLKPVLVIELDDPSHQWEGRAELDKFKDDTFASIGLLEPEMTEATSPASSPSCMDASASGSSTATPPTPIRWG